MWKEVDSEALYKMARHELATGKLTWTEVERFKQTLTLMAKELEGEPQQRSVLHQHIDLLNRILGNLPVIAPVFADRLDGGPRVGILRETTALLGFPLVGIRIGSFSFDAAGHGQLLLRRLSE